MPTRLSLQPLVLASGSATRRTMLEATGLEVVAVPAAVDEEEVKRSFQAEGLRPEDVAEALAEMKAARVAAKFPGLHVLGADQMLECGGRWFDKPADREQARAQLLALAGRTHRLVSSAVILNNGARIWHHTAHATLTMRAFGADFAECYLDAVGPAAFSSVGGYQLEGAGAQLFTHVTGDIFTVMGLPLLPLLDFLRVRGVVPA